MTVEDADDDDDSQSEGDRNEPTIHPLGEPVIIEDYPEELEAGKGLRKGDSPRLSEYKAQAANKQQPWAPCGSLEEWQLVQWFVQSGLPHSEIGKFMKLPWVRSVLSISSWDTGTETRHFRPKEDYLCLFMTHGRSYNSSTLSHRGPNSGKYLLMFWGISLTIRARR